MSVASFYNLLYCTFQLGCQANRKILGHIVTLKLSHVTCIEQDDYPYFPDNQPEIMRITL